MRPLSSCSTASTTAVRPSAIMSKTSAWERGRSRTRLPAPIRVPPTVTVAGPRLSMCAQKSSRSPAPVTVTTLDLDRAELPDRAVQPHELLRGEGVAAVDDLPGPGVGVPGLLLLLLG